MIFLSSLPLLLFIHPFIPIYLFIHVSFFLSFFLTLSLYFPSQISLEGMRRADFGPLDSIPVLSDFSMEIVANPKFKNQLARALRILPIELIETSDESNTSYRNSSNFKLKYRVLFEPLKVLNSSVELIVTSSRGRWRVTLDLDCTEPGPDDFIKLVAAVGGTDKVTFKLSNRFLGFSTFQAYFSVKSSTHFSVFPTSGILAPFGAEGTPFVISFTPLVYGNRETYVLHFVTELLF